MNRWVIECCPCKRRVGERCRSVGFNFISHAEQECVDLKGQLEEKEVEIETIRQEKTRVTKVCAAY